MESYAGEIRENAAALIQERGLSPHREALVECVCDPGAFKLKCVLKNTSTESANELRISLYPQDELAWISLLFVAPEIRLKGYGRRMAELAESVAFSAGCRHVRAHPKSGAEGFWRRLDYATVAGCARIFEKDLVKTMNALLRS